MVVMEAESREVPAFLKMISDGGGISTIFVGIFGLPKPGMISRPPEFLAEILGLLRRRWPAGFRPSNGDFSCVAEFDWMACTEKSTIEVVVVMVEV
ncbi:hypothetical protein ACJRO7_000395 [Eucalyptus globulus]|uniref:Uncharacterized protein n=1 Tax=Eucalyptus globulus TaxID=34317 RepID=A0ABD3LT89_EUCGL